jgi:hypothetical protein
MGFDWKLFSYKRDFGGALDAKNIGPKVALLKFLIENLD